LVPLKKGQQTSRQTCNFGDRKRGKTKNGESKKTKSVDGETKITHCAWAGGTPGRIQYVWYGMYFENSHQTLVI
jgi:hypothetical protein